VKAIQVREFGGPEVLVLREVEDPTPEDGEILIEVEAAGINYADTHVSENSYVAPATLPLIPGAEVVGTTADGRRVVSLLPSGGGYAEKALGIEPLTHEIPEGVDAAGALSTVLQGATAWHLLRTSTRMAEGEKVLVHAGAGGVGSIAIQLAKRWGAGTVVASASSEEKRKLCLDLGADAAIDPAEEDLKATILAAADGPVDVVLEMTGGTVTDQSLEALAPLGRLAFYGMASRKPPKALDAPVLLRRSRAVIGFWLVHAFAKRELARRTVQELLKLVAVGDLKPIVGGTYPLSEAKRAHEDIRARKTTGKLVLDASSS
jgi:NADPH2:quinone reductase